MKNIIIYILLTSVVALNAQNKQSKDAHAPLPVFIDKQPEFPGGKIALSDFINSNLKYPDIAKEKKNLGVSLTQIKIEVDGSISNIIVMKGIEGCLECDKEIKRLISIMPKWKPGIKDGKAIAVSTMIAIDFSTKSNDDAQALATDKEDIYTVVEEMPKFPGGESEKIKFIQKNLIFPESAIKNKTYGKCFLKFAIMKDGSIKDITILKGVQNCPACDEEAKRVVSIMPNWIPGKQNGNILPVYMFLPINFQSR